MKELVKVIIPEGSFKGNCTTCIFADRFNKDSYGRVHCDGKYGGYNYPKDRNGCNYYEAED